MIDNLQASYYIGEPAHGRRGQNKKTRVVRCLLWLVVGKKGHFTGFVKKSEHWLALSGGGIGSACNMSEARKKLHAFAVENLRRHREEAIRQLQRCNNALDALGDDPDNIEKFRGEYN